MLNCAVEKGFGIFEGRNNVPPFYDKYFYFEKNINGVIFLLVVQIRM
jgi:hypothetical protein